MLQYILNGHATGTDGLEVRTTYMAYFSGLCKGICPQNMARNMVQCLHFRILKFPLISVYPISYASIKGSMFMALFLPGLSYYNIYAPCWSSVGIAELKMMGTSWGPWDMQVTISLWHMYVLHKCIYICVYIHTHIHIYICVWICIYKHTHIYIYVI